MLYIVITISNTVVWIYSIKCIDTNHELRLFVDAEKERSNRPSRVIHKPRWKVASDVGRVW